MLKIAKPMESTNLKHLCALYSVRGPISSLGGRENMGADVCIFLPGSVWLQKPYMECAAKMRLALELRGPFVREAGGSSPAAAALP